MQNTGEHEREERQYLNPWCRAVVSDALTWSPASFSEIDRDEMCLNIYDVSSYENVSVCFRAHF
jgi:hypothetical protein